MGHLQRPATGEQKSLIISVDPPNPLINSNEKASTGRKSSIGESDSGPKYSAEGVGPRS